LVVGGGAEGRPAVVALRHAVVAAVEGFPELSGARCFEQAAVGPACGELVVLGVLFVDDVETTVAVAGRARMRTVVGGIGERADGVPGPATDGVLDVVQGLAEVEHFASRLALIAVLVDSVVPLARD